MANRRIRAGETITLRARFQDDIGQNAEANDVWVRIYSPDGDYNDPNTATVASGNATYFGSGIFEYQYATPSNGPDGTWYDQWNGELSGQQLFSQLQFEVAASGVVLSVENQLTVNNLVEVILHSGIRAGDGGWLQEDKSYTFLTQTTPTYTNVRKLRLDYGGFLSDLEDDTLQLSLLEASLEADELTFSTTQNTKVFQHARREWVTCKSATILMSNLGNNMLKSKSLGDLAVSYDTGGLQNSLQKAIDCLNRWEPQLMTGGYAKAVQNPQGVVKGEFDPDRPPSGRLWSSNSLSDVPAANTKAKYADQRRYKSIYSSKKRYW